MSFAVAENTREIGIRMALGAQPGDVLKLIGQGTVLILLGLGRSGRSFCFDTINGEVYSA